MISKTLTSLAAAAALALGAMSSAQANTVIDGIVIPAGATFSTINLFEGERLSGPGNNNGLIDTVGEELVGVGLVTSIQDSNNVTVWTNGQNGKRLTLVLENFFAADFNLAIAGSTQIGDVGFVGGSVKIFSQAAGTFNANGTQASVLAAAGAGTLWLDLTGSPSGGFAVNAPYTGQAVTLKSTAINTSGSNPFTTLANTNVTGRGFLDVAGGLAATYFNTDTYSCTAVDGAPCPDVADIKFTSSGQLNPLVAGQQEFGFRGTGEINAFTVPVPGTLALTGLALLGLGLNGRRNKAGKV